MERLARTAAGTPLARQRYAVLAVLLGLATAGWAVFLTGPRDSMDMGMGGPDLSMGGSAPLFLAMWVAMMVAMMLPAAAPMILMYARVQRRRPSTTALFTGAYLALWTAFGLVAFLFAVGVEHAAVSAPTARYWARAAGLLIVVAGGYQLSPVKDFCLRHCHSPLSFMMSFWRDGAAGAVRMGLRHGLYCAGCCWLLFLVLVPIGIMNVAATLAVAVVVFAEKVLPWGRVTRRLVAGLLVLYGLAVIIRPELLPTAG